MRREQHGWGFRQALGPPMMCDRCHQPVTREESKPYEVPGASGPGITIYVHKRPCALPSRPSRKHTRSAALISRPRLTPIGRGRGTFSVSRSRAAQGRRVRASATTVTVGGSPAGGPPPGHPPLRRVVRAP
ncbi:hypothetical protein GCM10010207_81260 [Streptomyces atratus]|nr:hypothetical protein GCM10010207_81260 [Streptomyces atratus]